jgi:hypothetical protein
VKAAATALLLTIPFRADFQDICGNRWLDRATTAKCESNFNPNARSFDGGEGLGQATRTWPWYLAQGWVPKGSTPFQVLPAIMGIHRHEGYLETRIPRWLPAGYSLWDATGGAYNAGEGNIRKAAQLAELASLPGDTPWLVTLPQVTKANSRYTIAYIKNKRAYRARLRAAFRQ